MFDSYGNSSNTNEENVMILGIFVGSMVFLMLPLCINIWQLHYGMKQWQNDIAGGQQLQAWRQTYMRKIYSICIFLGGAFALVSLCNTNIFHLRLFNMGLNRRQRAVFQNQRLFSTVLIEVYI